jgi:hypothetical protein
MGQKRRYRGNDARPVRTGKREDELMIGHGETLATTPCSITGYSLAPILQRNKMNKSTPTDHAYG